MYEELTSELLPQMNLRKIQSRRRRMPTVTGVRYKDEHSEESRTCESMIYHELEWYRVSLSCVSIIVGM